MIRRLNITLAQDLLARVDAFAKANRYSRSGLISAALDRFISEQEQAASESGDFVAAETVAPYRAKRDAGRVPSLDRVTDLLRAYFTANDDVEAAWVFGSVAHDAAGPMSDIDVALLPKGSPDADARWRMRIGVSGRLSSLFGGRSVDVAVLPDMGAVVAHRALVHGQRVFGERSRAAAEAEIQALNDYAEFASTTRQLDARLTERLGARALPR